MVQVKANKEGQVVVASGGDKGWGYIRLEEKISNFGKTGIINQSTRSCLVRGPLESLKALNFTPDQELEGKIVYVDSFKPQNELDLTQGQLINPKTQEVIKSGDKVVYRSAYYDATGQDKDVKFVYDTQTATVAPEGSVMAEEEDTMGM